MKSKYIYLGIIFILIIFLVFTLGVLGSEMVNSQEQIDYCYENVESYLNSLEDYLQLNYGIALPSIEEMKNYNVISYPFNN